MAESLRVKKAEIVEVLKMRYQLSEPVSGFEAATDKNNN